MKAKTIFEQLTSPDVDFITNVKFYNYGRGYVYSEEDPKERQVVIEFRYGDPDFPTFEEALKQFKERMEK